MRPGVVFVGLFLLLALVYQALAERLHVALIFVLQAVMVAALLALALWWRRRQRGKEADSLGRPQEGLRVWLPVRSSRGGEREEGFSGRTSLPVRAGRSYARRAATVFQFTFLK